MIETEQLIVDGTIPLEISKDALLNIKTTKVRYLTHGFHKYPGKFIPQLPKWAINKYLPQGNGLILDPFCGSGTTLIESILSNNNAIGFDIDPLSSLISKVKTTPVDVKLLVKISEWLEHILLNSTQLETFTPKCETLNRWFTEDAISKLSKIRYNIDNIQNEFGDTKSVKDIQDLLLICFSSIIRKVSNADNQSLKTYISHTKIKTPDEVYSRFFPRLEHFIKEITEFSNIANSKNTCKVINSSGLNQLKTHLSHPIDLVITSPPYIKSIDYVYNQMVELFWIGDLFEMETQPLQNLKKKKYIGNKYVRKTTYKDFKPLDKSTDIPILDNIIQQIYKTDEKNGLKHAYIVKQFFTDMELHFQNIYNHLRKNGHYVMIVGNSQVSNLTVNTADILIEIAQRSGYQLTNKWGYIIKNRYMSFNRKGRGGIIKIDWVLDFKKN